MATQMRNRTDVVELLKTDHRKVKELFKQYEELGERAYVSKQKLAEQIFRELEIHSKLEEEIFYPAVRRVGEKALGEVVAEGLEEHHVVDVLIEEIRALDPHEEAYDAKMKVLSENVEHHIEEEETEMLPDAESKLGSRVEELGSQMEQRRKELQAAS